QTGRPAQAAEAARQRREVPRNTVEDLYSIASDLALCAALPGKAKTLTAQEQAERKQFGTEALDTLRQAVTKGIKDTARLQKDQTFAALHPLPEFKQLLTVLGKQSSSPPKP